MTDAPCNFAGCSNPGREVTTDYRLCEMHEKQLNYILNYGSTEQIRRFFREAWQGKREKETTHANG